ncbi:hypothetical protein BDZ91DRAFT_766332 [Kalaharituber pfeilii]|nr:hypothetical protein BDZ91DRAFT_766332 [Kalaharituber pfeilii]
MDKIQGFGKNFAANFTPFAARSQQYLKEQLGQADDKVSNPPDPALTSVSAEAATATFSSTPGPSSTTALHDTTNAQSNPGLPFLPGLFAHSDILFALRRKLTENKTQLPADYIELEKRVDALKQVHQKLLAVTSQFNNEAYDYPPNLKESVLDLSRTIAEKVQLLPKASPKTFNHALGRAALASSHLLEHSDPLATALEKYALASEQVGEARLQQDRLIQTRFNQPFTTTLNTNLNVFATKARRNVENARLTLDSVKSRAKNGPLGFGLPNVGGQKKSEVLPSDDHLTEEQRAEIEAAEDEFIGATEEAVGVMKNVLDTPESLRNLADLVQAQLEYHKKAYEIYSELAPLIDGLQVEQEV